MVPLRRHLRVTSWNHLLTVRRIKLFPAIKRPVIAKTAISGRASPRRVAISQRRVVVIVRRSAGRQAAANGILSNFTIGVTMRPEKKFQALGLGWLAVIALLTSPVGAAEQVTLAPAALPSIAASGSTVQATQPNWPLPPNGAWRQVRGIPLTASFRVGAAAVRSDPRR